MPGPTFVRRRPQTVCHGYVNCCQCRECLQRAEDTETFGFTPEGKIAYPPPPAQPWEHKNAA